METHRYVHQLSSNSTDRYNGIGVAGIISQRGTPQNYWANGVTTEYWTACAKYQQPTTATTGQVGGKFNSSNATTSLAYRSTMRPCIPTNAASVSAPATHRGAATTPNSATGSFSKVKASLVAGSGAGLLTTCVLYPMELIRVKMQNCHKISPWQAVTKTVQHGGFRALYTGLTLPLAAQMVYKATVFTVNNVVQNVILDFKTLELQKFGNSNVKPELTMVDRFWCGAVAGSVNAAFFVTPVEYVRNQLIAQHTRLAAAAQASGNTTNSTATTYFRGAFCIVRDAHQNQGLLLLWRGASWSVSRDALGMGCFFFTMHWAQMQMTPPEQARPSVWTTVMSGGLAGLSFWMVALPMDTAKTWIQTASSTEEVSVKEVLHKIYSEQGATGVFRRLYRGWQAAFGRSVPSAAITLTSYSLLYQYLQEAL